MDSFVKENDELKNKINASLKNLEIKQPYTKCDNIYLYFKSISSSVDIIQNDENCLKFKYYSHDVKMPNFDFKQGFHNYDECREYVFDILENVDNYVNNVETTQIIKEITLNFSCELNRNFLDNELLNLLIEKYIFEKLQSKYKQYNIKNRLQEKNASSSLYKLQIESNAETYYEYFLIYNSICINATLNSCCNLSMDSIISKMLLSCDISKIYDKDNLYLDISKEELDLAFEIDKKDNIKVASSRILSENNEEQLTKLERLLKNYSELKEDSNFNNSIAYNSILYGDDTNEKYYLMDNIKKLFCKNVSSNIELKTFELDIKNDIDENFEKNINSKFKNSNYLIINNFDYIDNYDIQMQGKIINEIINIENIIGILLCGSKDKTTNIMRENKNLLDKFSFVFDCEDYSINDLYNLLISKIEKTNYKINFDENEAKIIIKSLLEKSSLKNEKFLNNLYTKMFKYVLENDKKDFDISSFPKVAEDKIINSAIEELNNLIGLENVKKEVNKLLSFWKFKLENSNVTNFDNQYINMFLTGNSGTGKTTIAKILCKILYSLNYIKEDKLIEITPNDLIADYEGQTKTKTKAVLNQARNGILFIDEAYLFLNDGNYYTEALIELLKYMENPQNIVIFAGYNKLMNDLLNLNNGLKSRVSIHLNFEDYTLDELLKIIELKFEKQNFKINTDALSLIKNILTKAMKEKNFGNARFVEKISTSILMKHAENVYLNSEKEILVISSDDIDENELLNNKIKNNNFGFIQENGDV